MGWRDRAAAALVVALSLLPLGGCDVLKKGRQAASLLRQDMQFSVPTRNRVDGDGRTWELMVESRTAASLLQADQQYSEQIARSCADGEPYEILEQSPESTDINHAFPAGTTFRQRIRCREPVPMEVLDSYAATGLLLAVIEGDEPDDRRHRVLYAPYSEFSPKYDTLNDLIGREIVEVSAACGGGVVVHDMKIGDHDESQKGFTYGTVTVALDITCADGRVVEPSRLRRQIPPALRLKF